MNRIEILKGVEAIDLCLWMPESKAMAMSDLHLGYEGMMNSQGVLLPRTNYPEIRKRLEEKVFPRTGRPEKIIINGDLKQRFGKASDQEWKEVLDMLQFLSLYRAEIIIIKGNHDRALGPVAMWQGMKVVEDYFLEKEKVLFVHGDKIPAAEKIAGAKTIVIGHEHPCVAVSDGVKRETYKCFLTGKFRRKNLIVLPSMCQVHLGHDVTREGTLSPMVKNIGNFRVFAVEDGIYDMGGLRDLVTG